MVDWQERDKRDLLKDVCLCVITDRGLSRGRSLVEVVGAAIRGGTQMVQFRDKELPDGEFYRQALKLRELTRQAGVLFIIDDRVDVALCVGADGIHVGEKDLPLEPVRELIGPEMILGASARTPHEVQKAHEAGADYLGVGAIFATRTKEDIVCVGPERLTQLRSLATVPILAIGGITADNASHAILAGADGVAVISSVVGADDITRATSLLIEKVQEARRERS